MNRIILSFSLLFAGELHAQWHTAVFPELEGNALIEEVVNEYKPINILSYGGARDTMFSKIDNHNDSLTCVYTGHTIYLDPYEDPTQAAFMNGSSSGINTEHTYPQSMGAEEGNARSDMHHLFPTRSGVNSARGNKPFDDINDNVTDVWYYLNKNETSIPSSGIIDLFSESASDRFEPRESHKGNVARAMFYFYTIYKNEAIAANSVFFEDQKETLCQWHFDDPVDERELERTMKIAKYQEGRANPFIYDCTLATRLYCPLQSCEVTAVDNVFNSEFDVFPNPAEGMVTVQITEPASDSELLLIDMHGQIVREISVARSTTDFIFDVSSIKPGMYLIQVKNGGTHFDSKVLVVR